MNLNCLKNKKIRLLIYLTALIIIIFATLNFPDSQKLDSQKLNLDNLESTNIDLRAGVIYAGGKTWKDTYEHLEQSLLANMSVAEINIEEVEYDLSLYDLIYLDKSIISGSNKEEIRDRIIEFTKAGGGVFLENEFYNFFNKDFIGGGEFVKLKGSPDELDFPDLAENLMGLQEIIRDFDYLYKDYKEYELLETYDYGYGVKNSKATVLAEENGIALYTVNKVGQGYVFFTNPLLPNNFNINGYSMKATNDLQKYFANTTASGNQLIKSQFAAYLSKEKYGFSLERVFGNYGRPSMAWQLHYEEITAFENNSLALFADLAEENLQIPSFTVIRNTYNWFHRFETLTYLLNENKDESLIYAMDEYENAYSSGKHIAAENEWLSLGLIENGGSYFVDYPEYELRAYPFAMDLNNDGVVDLLSGSQDGYFHFFQGKKMGDNFETSGGQKLTNSEGKPLSVAGYSAGLMLDIDGDGILDLISGSIDGNIYWFSANGDLTFEKEGILVKAWQSGQSLPSMGDINNDGIPDLIVGGNNKKLKVYYGKKEGTKLEFPLGEEIDIVGLENIEGQWISPYIVDINADGLNDIVVGTFHGYIGKFIGDGDKFVFQGYMEGQEKNYKGNKNLKFGNNSVPTFADLNNDGKLDLIVGCLEYGLAYPIDSPYFPMKSQLSEQIRFMVDKGYYIGFHYYSNEHASDDYEKNELAMHFKALEAYGIDRSQAIGFNQHTWHTNKENKTQTLENGFDAGLLWNSGFRPSGSSANPEGSAETALTIPFYFEDKNDNKPIVFNTSTLLFDNRGWADITAKYDLPVSMYYHCDFAYENLQPVENNVVKAGNFAKKYDYNFVTEDQYVKAIAASYNTEFSLSLDTLKGKLEVINIETQTKDKTIPLYDPDYQGAVGLKLVLGEKYIKKTLNTDSPIWYQNDNTLYMGLDGKARVTFAKGDEFHLNRANLPVQVTYGENEGQVTFKSGGMMQVEVAGNVHTQDQGWIITKSENRDATILTKFGPGQTLNIKKID